MPEAPLHTYNEKRDFRLTPEPAGKTLKRKNSGLMFVVQKHAATRLHYDFRLEWNGVLLSWAIPKGPSYFSEDKRLAVRTEDHPISYGDFEGIIPEKQYGAGPVMVWDTGMWEPVDKDFDKAFKKGKFTFILKGEKLRGEWTLFRMRTKDKQENWLLVKHKDDLSVNREDKNFLKKTDYSVKTGRSFKDIAKTVSPQKTKAAARPKKDRTQIKTLENKYPSVELATLADAPPRGPAWTHEIKYDGYRILVFFKDGKVKIKTRNGHDWTDRFPVLKKAFQNLEIGTFVIDGEAVMINSEGLTDFKALQNALDDSKADMQGYFFDILYWNGQDFAKKPFSERRQALEALFEGIPDAPLHLSQIIKGDAKTILEKACDLNLEGLISKKKNAAYKFKRSKNWLKSKCGNRQEFIICGYIPASEIPKAIGSLHLGYYKNGELVYAGKVGTGFNQISAHDLYDRLHKMEIKKPPFDKKITGAGSKTVWVEPKLLCEVAFGSWTKTGKLRHSSYQGLREDKNPEKIIREKPEHIKTKEMKEKNIPRKKTALPVSISNADREIFPGCGITKGMLAEFYHEMADLIIPQIAQRPLSIVRCPGGMDTDCFFQRSKGKGMPDHIYEIDIKHNKKNHDYFYIRNATGLVEIVQMGGIEIHPWGVKIDNTEKPDRIIFDLDPDEGVPFEAVKLAAMDVRNRLEHLGLTCFLKCTGGKGLHISAPIKRTQNWETIKTFTKAFAENMTASTPDAYTTNLLKKNRKGKIFIDYLRNDFASTAVMDYCVRARGCGPVAIPLAWEELESLHTANQFSLEDGLSRKKAGRKLLKDWLNTTQAITKAMYNEVL